MGQQPKSFFEWLQRILIVAASVGSVLIAVGYVVVNAALDKLRMPLYTVTVTQYVAAGAYFLVVLITNLFAVAFFVWYLVKVFFYTDQFSNIMAEYLPGLWQILAPYLCFVIVALPNHSLLDALLIALIPFGVGLMIGVVGGLIVLAAPNVDKILLSRYIQFPPLGRLIKAFRGWISRAFPRWQKYVVLALPVSFVYCLVQVTTSYIATPQFLGGGEAGCINLIFKDPGRLTLLDFSVHPADDHRTDKVSVLAVTGDGLLVLDQGKGRAIEVKNDLIDGYVRCDPLDGYPTPTLFPTATLSGMNLPTQSAIATSSQPLPMPPPTETAKNG